MQIPKKNGLTLIPATEVFELTRFNNNQAFDLDFRRRQNFNPRNYPGPAIYAFFYRDELIYLGSYKNDRHNIFSDRWKRHLMSFTLRGRNLTFGNPTNNNDARINRIRAWFQPEPNLFDFFSAEFIRGRQQIGYVLSRNRASFAVNNWDSFQNNPDNWLNHFKLGYYNLPLNSDSCSTNRLLLELEKMLIDKCNPRCNREYDPNGAESGCKIDDVNSALKASLALLKAKYMKPPK